MLYRAEIWAESKLKVGEVFKAAHPKQAIRKIVEALERTNAAVRYLTVYVLNEEGQVWVYSLVKQQDDKFHAKNIGKTTEFVPQNHVLKIFAGNLSIRGVVH